MSQLALPLKLQDHAVFESFLPAGNEAIVAFLEDAVADRAGPGCWIAGARAAGKTHLLQAVCERAGDAAQFVPLAALADAGPAILDGLQARAFVCIDDVDRVAGDEAWEIALFALCNALADTGGILVCAAAAVPRECGFRLADLESRFSRLPAFQLRSLDEAERVAALRLRARHRGLELPAETAAYLLTHSRRDMASLYELLDRLDNAALKAQRRLTIPFAKEVLGIRTPG
ncbi:MAG: DnaA regulatory inactivator Hda [Gammaproteobacteria bacterium]|nr:DnaA regulatory inactivator Hda [Gammaproteobacteria bacterium]